MLAESQHGWAIATLVAFSLLASPAQDAIEKYRAEYERATNPVLRAKVLARLEKPEFARARELVDAGEVDEAARLLRDYRDRTFATEKALQASGINAEKHSNGFRQLQIAVREGLRQLSDIITRVPFEQQKPYLDLQQDFRNVNRQLMLDLFPRRPPGDKPQKQHGP